MRGEIRPLAEEVVARIAAGEVVERPAAALKELVENALDAGARRVEVRLAGGGADLLEVVDDGEGMPADALPLALTRHATSKIRTAEDLGAVSTYGFRGEALPAIAAAAGRLLVASCPEGGSGAEVEVVEGRAGPVLPAAVAPGTRVRVERLFAHLPARRAFLRSPQAEAAACHEVVVRAALAAPAVAFRLRSERGEVFASPGGGDRAQVVAAAYGPAVRAALVAVDHRQDGVGVSGYVALPHVARANRGGQTFLVRGRPVLGRSLVYAAESAYAGRLPRARYPLFVLAVDLDPGEVDVNVHPQKREVRFADERRVAAAVHEAVRRALGGTAAPAAPAPQPPPQGTGAWRAGWPAARPAVRAAAEAPRPWPGPGPEAAPPVRAQAPAPPAPDAPPPLLPLRQLRLTYILAEGPDGLYVVDQHAAHERVRYEALEEAEGRGGEGVARQRLMPAAVVDLTPGLVEALEAYAGEVAAAGFRAEPFGGASVRIAEAPADVRLPGQVLRDLLSLLSDPGEAAPPAHRRRALMACRTAVRAGDALAPAEMARILDSLARCRFPATCPHGRPTVHRLPWDEVAAWFRRRG